MENNQRTNTLLRESEVGRVQSVVILRTTTDLTLLLNLDGRDRHEEEGT